MQPYSIGDLIAFDYASLAPRDFFIHESVSDDQALGLVLPNDDSEILQILTLTGKEAFVVREFERVYNKSHPALPLKVDHDRVRLRVEISDSTPASVKHQPGRLVVGNHQEPSIEVMLAPDGGRPAQRTVSLKDWKLGHARQPKFAFDRWSLSYIDESGQWVDLVRRESASAR